MNKDTKLIYEAYAKGFTGVKTDDYNKRWYVNGKLHRTDGPAVEWPNGSKQCWVNGELIKKTGPLSAVLDNLGIEL